MGGKRGSVKRAVYVDGVRCESMSAGARYAGRILKRTVFPYEIRRAANGVKKIPGLDVAYATEPAAPKKRFEKTVPAPAAAADVDVKRRPLVRWPTGESPVERGLPEAWR